MPFNEGQDPVAQESMDAQRKGNPAPEQGGESNPVVDAVETLAKYIAIQIEKGDPKASAMQSWLQEGIKLLTGGGEEQPQQHAPQQPPPESNEPKEMTRDINAGKNATRVL